MALTLILQVGNPAMTPSWGRGPGSESFTCLSTRGEDAEEECEGVALIFIPSKPWESHM